MLQSQSSCKATVTQSDATKQQRYTLLFLFVLLMITCMPLYPALLPDTMNGNLLFFSIFFFRVKSRRHGDFVTLYFLPDFGNRSNGRAKAKTNVNSPLIG